MLRAIAAVTVAVLHVAFAFADHVGAGLGLKPGTGLSGQIAVMLFFIVSGYVMVIAAGGAFGQRGASRAFWLRRFNRIMPPYWLATAALAGVFLTVEPQPVPLLPLLKSLALVPFWQEGGGLRPIPFLWVGWTLFYEMVFYALFGLALGLGRSAGLAVTVAGLGLLVLVGLIIGPDSAFLFAVTRPVLLMFVVGMGLALRRTSGGQVPVWLRIAALAALVPAMTLIPVRVGTEAMGFDYLAWCGVPAALLGLAVLGGPLAVPGSRWVIAAGDMSYALYLLHVPVAWFWLWFWRRLPGFDPGPWDYLISALVVSLVASWLFHRRVERPITAALNRRVGSPHGGQHSA